MPQWLGIIIVPDWEFIFSSPPTLHVLIKEHHLATDTATLQQRRCASPRSGQTMSVVSPCSPKQQAKVLDLINHKPRRPPGPRPPMMSAAPAPPPQCCPPRPTLYCSFPLSHGQPHSWRTRIAWLATCSARFGRCWSCSWARTTPRLQLPATDKRFGFKREPGCLIFLPRARV